jgi:hypothetical protein
MATTTSAQIDVVVIEHRVGHRTEYFSNDGILWIRDTLDGRVLEISVEEFLAMPIAAYIRHMEVDQSAAPGQERTRGLGAGSA